MLSGKGRENRPSVPLGRPGATVRSPAPACAVLWRGWLGEVARQCPGRELSSKVPLHPHCIDAEPQLARPEPQGLALSWRGAPAPAATRVLFPPRWATGPARNCAPSRGPVSPLRSRGAQCRFPALPLRCRAPSPPDVPYRAAAVLVGSRAPWRTGHFFWKNFSQGPKG